MQHPAPIDAKLGGSRPPTQAQPLTRGITETMIRHRATPTLFLSLSGGKARAVREAPHAGPCGRCLCVNPKKWGGMGWGRAGHEFPETGTRLLIVLCSQCKPSYDSRSEAKAAR